MPYKSRRVIYVIIFILLPVYVFLILVLKNENVVAAIKNKIKK